MESSTPAQRPRALILHIVKLSCSTHCQAVQTRARGMVRKKDTHQEHVAAMSPTRQTGHVTATPTHARSRRQRRQKKKKQPPTDVLDAGQRFSLQLLVHHLLLCLGRGPVSRATSPVWHRLFSPYSISCQVLLDRLRPTRVSARDLRPPRKREANLTPYTLQPHILHPPRNNGPEAPYHTMSCNSF